jgi:hypothetical protein
MMAEMNALLEEAEGRCIALSDELDTAVTAIDTVESRASALYEHASRSGAQVKARLEALAARMDVAEQALATARQGATSELDALAAQATTVRASVTGLLDHVREQLTALQLQQTRLDEATSARLSGVETDVAGLAEKVQAAQQAVAAELTEAGESVDRFSQAVHAAQASLVAQQGDLDGVLEALETSAAQKAAEWAGGIQSLLAAQTTAMVDLANRAIAGHNNTMETLQHGFAVEARNRVTASFAPLQDNLDRLARAAGRQQGLLSAQAQDAVARVRSIVPVLEELRASFEQSRRLA